MQVKSSAVICLFLTITFYAGSVFAGFYGHNSRGDVGLMSGTQLPPGFWAIPAWYHYDGDSTKGKDGESIQIDPEGRGSLGMNLYVLGGYWVSDYKILGANYSFQLYGVLADNRFEVPILGTQDSVDTNITDSYCQPINLGWHTDRADFITGLGVYIPTGEYEPGGSENLGLGMWSFEVFAGTTIYFDEAKSWHFAATAFYETHTEKEDTDITVGDILTIEGGLGKSFMDGALSVGAAYFGQWKITDDDLGSAGEELLNGRSLGKFQIYGIGPELVLPLATKKKLYGLVSLRYLWEFGAESTVEGNTFVLTFALPIPSKPLQ